LKEISSDGEPKTRRITVVWSPQAHCFAPSGAVGDRYSVGHELVDDFLEFAASRARSNTVRAYAHDLKAFFAVAKEPADVRPPDVMTCIAAHRGDRSKHPNARDCSRAEH
jgi:hypothetical protein